MELEGVMVVTTDRLAETYKCSAETLIWNYLQHRELFVEGVHYYELTLEELNNCEKRFPQEFVECTCPYLWTFEGMYKHAQLLSGKDAWRAYMRFIYCHFQQSEELKRSVQLLEKALEQIEGLYIYNFDEMEWFEQ